MILRNANKAKSASWEFSSEYSIEEAEDPLALE
jgi:hypothetical protein